MTLIQADDRGRVTLPGQKGGQFLMEQLADGSVLLQPVGLRTPAQEALDKDPTLQAILDQALAQAPVRFKRPPRRQ